MVQPGLSTASHNRGKVVVGKCYWSIPDICFADVCAGGEIATAGEQLGREEVLSCGVACLQGPAWAREGFLEEVALTFPVGRAQEEQGTCPRGG